MHAIDINCDMGESFGVYTIGDDEEVMNYITSANIACGFHAGDPMVMDRTVRLAVEHGVHVGCHPGYLDLVGFGRRAMALSLEEMESYVLYQIGAAWAFTRAHKTDLRHVKPHGALGTLTFTDMEAARAITRSIARFSKELLVICEWGIPLVTAAKEMGLRVVEEFYPERAYCADGTLLSRKYPGACIEDPKVAVERAIRVVREGIVIAHTGEAVKLQAASMCVHGDNPAATAIARALMAALKAEGIQVKPASELL